MSSLEEKELHALEKVENDEFLSLFLNCNIKSELLKNLTITEQVKRLGEGIDLISRELQKQVLNKHNDLIKQAAHANKLESMLNTMNVHMQNLFANAERLKTQLIGPYQALEMHTTILSRLHTAGHILRQVNRIQQLSKRLSNINDPVQKATILKELDQLTSDSNLTDIDAVTTELRNIRAQQQKVVKLATSSLTQGISTENITQTTTALQIFINLGTIKSATENIVNICLDECRDSLRMAFDTTGVNLSGINNKKQGGPGRAAVTSSQGFRTRVWNDLEKSFLEELYQQSKQIKFLQGVLNNLNMSTNEHEIAKYFWIRLGEYIVEEINNSVPAIQQMLETDYPKLLKLYRDMSQKLDFDEFIFNPSILDKWENVYLSKSLNQLLEPTQSMFTQENLAPNNDQIDSVIRHITNELSVALVEEHLTEKVAKNVSKCIRMFAVKTEQQLSTGPDAAQILAGAPNVGQQLNVQLANALYYLHEQVQRILTNMKDSFSSAVVDIINDGLHNLNNLTSAIIQPIAVSINSTIETIIVTIHLEQDWTKLQVPTGRSTMSCSPYMRELTQFITRVHNTYLTPFDNKEVLALKCSEIVIRCIDLLIRHSSLLRPLSQGGRFRLQADFIAIENTLKLLYPYLSDLGRPYRMLKSMASLIILPPEEIVRRQMSGSSVSHTTVLLLLFSYAGAELASPHQNAAWSLSKLSSWLDEHPLESDRLELIAGALQRYENIIRQKKLANYDPVYPIMSDFLEFATKASQVF